MPLQEKMTCWTASGISYGFVLVPILTVILAAFRTDDIISVLFLVGAAVVLPGVYVGALMPSEKGAETTEPPEENIQARPGLPTCV